MTQDAYGTLTLGRQYDPLVDLVQPLTGSQLLRQHVHDTPSDVDNGNNSSRTNNAIKYVSPVWGGFQFEGMYALSADCGRNGAGNPGQVQQRGRAVRSALRRLLPHADANTLTSRGVAPGNQGGTWNAGVTSDGTFDGSNVNGAYASAKQIDIRRRLHST